MTESENENDHFDLDHFDRSKAKRTCSFSERVTSWSRKSRRQVRDEQLTQCTTLEKVEWFLP